MPSAEAVEVSIIATCCAVSFSYVVSAEPAGEEPPSWWSWFRPGRW